MAPPRNMPSTNDLFKIFPDLPGVRLRTAEEQVAQVRRQAHATRQRWSAHILRQRAATERVRTAILRGRRGQ
jgi:hypothetical protein